MTDDEKRAIFAELAELAGLGRPPAGAVTFTAREYGNDLGVSTNTATRHLRRLVDGGVLGSCLTLQNGRREAVYWKL